MRECYAQAGDDHSIQITLDVTPYTWSDLFATVMRDQSSFREALPIGAWQSGRASPRLKRGYRDRCRRLGDADLERAMAAMLERFIDDIDALPSRGLDELHGLGGVGLDTVVQQRPFARS